MLEGPFVPSETPQFRAVQLDVQPQADINLHVWTRKAEDVSSTAGCQNKLWAPLLLTIRKLGLSRC